MRNFCWNNETQIHEVNRVAESDVQIFAWLLLCGMYSLLSHIIKSRVIDGIKQRKLDFSSVSFLYHNDPEVVRATALVDPQYLYCADAALRDSDFIAGVVIKQLVQGAFEFSACDVYHAHPMVARAAVALDARHSRYLQPSLREEPAIVRAVVKQIAEETLQLQDIAPLYVDCKAVVLCAMEVDVSNFFLASARLQKDKDVVNALCNRLAGDSQMQRRRILTQLITNTSWGSDVSFCALVIRYYDELYYYFSKAVRLQGACLRAKQLSIHERCALLGNFEELMEYKPFYQLALDYKDKPSRSVLYFLPKELRNDRDFMRPFIHKNGGYLQYCGSQLIDDQELVIEAIQKTPSAFRLCSKRLQHNQAVVIAMLKTFPLSYRFMLQVNHPLCLCDEVLSVMVAAVKDYPEVYEWLPERYKVNEALAFSVVSLNPRAYRHVGTNLKLNDAFNVSVLKHHGAAALSTMSHTPIWDKHFCLKVSTLKDVPLIVPRRYSVDRSPPCSMPLLGNFAFVFYIHKLMVNRRPEWDNKKNKPYRLSIVYALNFELYSQVFDYYQRLLQDNSAQAVLSDLDSIQRSSLTLARMFSPAIAPETSTVELQDRLSDALSPRGITNALGGFFGSMLLSYLDIFALDNLIEAVKHRLHHASSNSESARYTVGNRLGHI